MTNSGTVTSDSESFKSIVSGYNSAVSGLSGSWMGESADNFKTITDDFSSEFGKAIQNQLNSFSKAVSLYAKYKTAKEKYEIARSNYYEAKKAENSSKMHKYRSEAKEYKEEMEELKPQIEAALDAVCSQKLASVNYSATGDFINYYQFNYNNPYSQGTIATSGCGPTSLAMVLTYLLGEEISPVETAEKGNGRYTCSQGTYWSFFGDMAKEYGVNCEQNEVSRDRVVDDLNNGKPIIMSMRAGHFTKGGHFIVLRDIDKNGKITVADPNSEENSKQKWDLDVFMNEGTQMWTMNNS